MILLKKWEDLPEAFRTPEVRPYYDILARKPVSLAVKRIFDIGMSAVLIVLLACPMGVIAILVKKSSEGPVFYRQQRITTYGKPFRIHKFRTMVNHADQIGSEVTVGDDKRITPIGARLRKYRLDELPQVFDIFCGNMSFVGTRPEVKRYVDAYTPEMYATLLMPAGVTSETSILYKDEAELLEKSADPDRTYIETILPEKMKYNLASLKNFNIFNDLKTMVKTIAAVLK